VSRQPVHLGYASVPLPLTVGVARREGRLSLVEADLLRYLYERADFDLLARRAETPRLTVAAIAENIRWEGEPRSLVRLLQRLRDEGWFDYGTERGKGKRGGVHVYVFTLRPDALSSPVSEGENAVPEPDSAPADPEPVAGIEPVAGLSPVSGEEPSPVSDSENALPERGSTSERSEAVAGFDAGNDATSSPQSASSSPVSEPQTPPTEPDSAPSPDEPVRPPQKDQREENPRSEEGNALGKTTGASELVERNGKPDEAADERLVERVEPAPALCRYPQHRHSDWIGDGNRLICGTCHPAARTKIEEKAA
jgi:hypothetical protein